MTRREKVRNVSLLVLSIFVVIGTGVTYRALVDRWKGDPRGTLIGRRVRAGIAFFVSTVLTLSWAKRREDLKRRKPPN